MLTDQYGDPLAARKVIFTLGAAGTGRFAGNALTATVTTDRDGMAVAPPITAGLRAGRWTVLASTPTTAADGSVPAANYSLTNTLN
jgi:hypothetical protein